MNLYKTIKKKLPGTSFQEIDKSAKLIYKQVKAKSKRTPYIRSKYFKKDKIFLTIFWQHIYNKKEKDRVRRLNFLIVL